ncbi:MAG: complement resistance protein TraT [Gammaproteobacteria bacterium]|nr:complement resistance protein TraT [Gammaproteobacteria bacterium]
MIATPLHAGDTIFGQEGSGRPTNTVVGALFGAATGAAIGQATGGKDGWWIGSLVGTAVGGSAGNLLPAEGHRRHHTTYTSHSAGYKPRFTRSYYSRDYCEPVVYRPEPVVVKRAVVVEEAPVVVEPVAVPYGFLEGGQIKSPWSEFSMSVGGLSAGQTVYDGLTGKAFRVP